MSLYAISDLHLSFSADKSMEIFRGWENYTDRIAAHWNRLVREEDTVVIAGDVSWAMGLDAAMEDFSFLERLPGQKIILKGNHDYWWTTMAHMVRFADEHHFNSLHFLNNNCFPVGPFAVCGTRGWLYDGSGEHDEKLIRRECGRLEASLEAAVGSGLSPVVFLHYPPAYGEFRSEEILDVLHRYQIADLYYGHIHGAGRYSTAAECDGIRMHLISGDCVDFTPVFIG